jgi:hypothetical protein
MAGDDASDRACARTEKLLGIFSFCHLSSRFIFLNSNDDRLGLPQIILSLSFFSCWTWVWESTSHSQFFVWLHWLYFDQIIAALRGRLDSKQDRKSFLSVEVYEEAKQPLGFVFLC